MDEHQIEDKEMAIIPPQIFCFTSNETQQNLLNFVDG